MSYVRSPDGPSESSPAYTLLMRRAPALRIARWTNNRCDLVPNGRIFNELDVRDRTLYADAGGIEMGVRVSGGALSIGSEGIRYDDTAARTWCCDSQRVIQVFEEYTRSPAYKRNRYMGIAFASLILGASAYALWHLKKSGKKATYSWSFGQG